MMIRFLFALLLCVALPASAQDSNRFASTLVPAERFEVGATLVERHGRAGAPVVLIPGLASGAWAWQDAARQLMGEHAVYVLTLPGFDGRPAIAGKGIAAAQESLLQLVTSRKLKKPVLIGHSLGGTLALGFAAEHPALVGGVVSLDGLPLLPGTEEWDELRRVRSVESVSQRRVAATAEQFAAQQQFYMRGTGVVDMARADELARLSAKSDPAAVTGYMAEALSIDLRPKLKAITAPVLVLMPYFDVDAEQQQLTEAAKIAYYATLMEGTPNLKVLPVRQARHFAMFDQPQAVNEAIKGFIQSLPK